MNNNEIKKNCLNCEYYECNSLFTYTYVFGDIPKRPLILDKDGSCYLSKDIDKDSNKKIDFDREKERDCCTLGIIQTTLNDEELQKAKSLQELSAMFNNKYHNKYII